MWIWAAIVVLVSLPVMAIARTPQGLAVDPTGICARVGAARVRQLEERIRELKVYGVRDVGFDPVDAGGAERTADVEAFARLVIGLAYAQGRGPFVSRFEPG